MVEIRKRQKFPCGLCDCTILNYASLHLATPQQPVANPTRLSVMCILHFSRRFTYKHALNSQVKSLASSCPEELSRGNVLAWPDFVSGITGKVKVDSSSIFCSGEDFSLTPLPDLDSSGMFCPKCMIQKVLLWFHMPILP